MENKCQIKTRNGSYWLPSVTLLMQNCVICVTSRYAPEAFATLSSATKMQTRRSLPIPLHAPPKSLVRLPAAKTGFSSVTWRLSLRPRRLNEGLLRCCPLRPIMASVQHPCWSCAPFFSTSRNCGPWSGAPILCTRWHGTCTPRRIGESSVLFSTPHAAACNT